jgi:hypothetical protein
MPWLRQIARACSSAGIERRHFNHRAEQQSDVALHAKDDPAHPSAAKYIFTKTNRALRAEFTILCEASAGQCKHSQSDIRGNVVQLFKMMASDSPMTCSLIGKTLGCEPVRATGSLD